MKRFHIWRKRIYRGVKIRIQRCINADFWICDYASNYWFDENGITNDKGQRLAFGNTQEEALEDAKRYLDQFNKIPFNLKNDVDILVNVRQPTLKERFFMNSDNHIGRVVA